MIQKGECNKMWRICEVIVSLKWKDACKALLNGMYVNDMDMYNVIMLVEEICFPSCMQVGCMYIVEIKLVISHSNTFLGFLHKFFQQWDKL